MVQLRRLPLFLLALGLAAGLPAEPEATSDFAPTPLLLPLPSTTRPDAPDPKIRAVAVRRLIYAGKTSFALQALKQEKNPLVLAEALSALGDRHAQTEAGDFILQLRLSPDPHLAALAYTVLGPSPLGTSAILQEGWRHPDSQVRLAALAAAADSPEAEEMQSALLEQCQSVEAADRAVAVSALFQITQAESPEEISPLAQQLLATNTALAEPVLAALLRLGLQPDAAQTAFLSALPPEQMRSLVAVYRRFPNQLDSDLLRAIATRTDSREAATEAVQLLARKSSPKTTATIKTLSATLQSENLPLLAAFLAHFDTDLEFSSFSQSAKESTEIIDNKDRFHSFEMATTAIVSGNAPAQESHARNPQTDHTVKPDSTATLQFLDLFDALGRNAQLSGFQRARAALLLQQTIRGANYPDLLHQLLDPGNPALVTQAAARSALLCWENPRFAEIAMLAAQNASSPRAVLADISGIAPYLAIKISPETTQIFSAIGRLLLHQQAVEKQMLGLILLSHHGAPSDAATLLPFLQSTNPALRRAAWQTLSSAAPEVFFLRAEEILADTEPGIRIILPLTLLKSGYRWEHRLDATTALPQWIIPRFTVPSHPLPLYKIFDRLALDSNTVVRKIALLASIQHEVHQLQQTTIDQLLPPSGEPLLAVQLRTSFPSQLLNPAGEAEAIRQQHPVALAVFLHPENPLLPEAEAAVYMFRQLHPRKPVRLFYSGSEHARQALQALCTVVPIPLADRQNAVLVVSSGSWWNGETTDLARLEELAQDSLDARDPTLLEKLLPPAAASTASLTSVANSVARILPLLLGTLVLLLGLAGVWWWRKKSPSCQHT